MGALLEKKLQQFWNLTEKGANAGQGSRAYMEILARFSPANKSGGSDPRQGSGAGSRSGSGAGSSSGSGQGSGQGSMVRSNVRSGQGSGQGSGVGSALADPVVEPRSCGSCGNSGETLTSDP